jgi:tetratricopeptide (TPR) repeat protein
LETPTDIQLRLQQGYVLKATAQAYSAAGEQEAADRSLQEAESIFRLAIRDIPADPETQHEIASAVNGLGNVLAERGRHAEAVPLYVEAVRLMPSYAYAWHDLFASLVSLADAGDLRPTELDEAWSGLLGTAPGTPGLEPGYLEELRIGHYERLRPAAAG